MARLKGRGARSYGRHTGELYDSGYQYVDPQRNVLVLGPWQGSNPGEQLHNVKDRFYTLSNARIDAGVVRPIWKDNGIVSDTNYSSPLFAQFFQAPGGTYYSLLFRTVTGPVVQVRNIVTGANTNSPVAGPTVPVLSAVQWGDVIYIGLSTEIYKITLSTLAWTAVGGPANIIAMAIIDNNVVAVDYSGTIHWSADGNPEDWSGLGSGTYDPNELGASRHVVAVHEDLGYALFEFGGVRITPTGTSDPTFRFERVPGITGGAYRSQVKMAGGVLLYANQGQQLVAFDGNREQPIGRFIDTLAPVLWSVDYVRSIDRILCSTRTDRVLVLNPYTLEIESHLSVSTAAVAMCEYVTGSFGSQNYGFYVILNGNYYKIDTRVSSGQESLTPSDASEPLAETHLFNLSAVRWIDEIILQRTSTSGPKPKLTLTLYTRGGTSQSVVIDPGGTAPKYKDDGTLGHYYINAPCDMFKISLSAATGGSSWSRDRGLEAMLVYFKDELQENVATS